METQQILEILAKLNAKMDANQGKAETSMSVSMKSNQNLLARFEARIETNREKLRRFKGNEGRN
jgi:hypothetical protein